MDQIWITSKSIDFPNIKLEKNFPNWFLELPLKIEKRYCRQFNFIIIVFCQHAKMCGFSIKHCLLGGWRDRYGGLLVEKYLKPTEWDPGVYVCSVKTFLMLYSGNGNLHNVETRNHKYNWNYVFREFPHKSWKSFFNITSFSSSFLTYIPLYNQTAPYIRTMLL